MRYLILVLVGLLALACSSADKSEGALRRAVEDYANAIAEGEAATAYKHVDESFKDKCPFSDFTGALLFGRAFFGEEFANAEYRVSTVHIDGDRATIEGDFYLEDEPLHWDEAEDDYPNYWLWSEGKWRTATDDPDPCGLSS